MVRTRSERTRVRIIGATVVTVTILLVVVLLAGVGDHFGQGTGAAAGTMSATTTAPAARPTAPASTGAGASPPAAPAAGTDVLPRIGAAQDVEQDDVGDPFILPVPSGIPSDRAIRYVLFWTTDWRSNVPTAVSSDLVRWRRVADSLPVLPTWALPNRTMTWGPSAIRVAGGWVLYFSTQDAASKLECIGAAFSTDPIGPYVDSAAAPLVCQPSLGGSIDPSVLRDGTGGLALVWKSDGNAVGAPVGIWEQALSPDGRSVTGTASHLLGASQGWEQGIVEGPALLADRTGGWWLFYSGGSWQSNTYDTGVAWCATLSGPCLPTATRPWLTSTPTAVSPGGLDTFVDAKGKLWASYSAFPSAPANRRAAMAEDRVLEIAPILSW